MTCIHHAYLAEGHVHMVNVVEDSGRADMIYGGRPDMIPESGPATFLDTPVTVDEWRASMVASGPHVAFVAYVSDRYGDEGDETHSGWFFYPDVLVAVAVVCETAEQLEEVDVRWKRMPVREEGYQILKATDFIRACVISKSRTRAIYEAFVAKCDERESRRVHSFEAMHTVTGPCVGFLQMMKENDAAQGPAPDYPPEWRSMMTLCTEAEAALSEAEGQLIEAIATFLRN